LTTLLATGSALITVTVLTSASLASADPPYDVSNGTGAMYAGVGSNTIEDLMNAQSGEEPSPGLTGNPINPSPTMYTPTYDGGQTPTRVLHDGKTASSTLVTFQRTVTDGVTNGTSVTSGTAAFVNADAGDAISGLGPARTSAADGNTTVGSTTITSATAAFSAADVFGTITGTGIVAGSVITAVTNATTATISTKATLPETTDVFTIRDQVIPSGATISSVTNGTTVVLSAAATANVSPVTVAIESPDANLRKADVGAPISDSAGNIPAGDTILNVTNNFTAVLTTAATGTLQGDTITIGQANGSGNRVYSFDAENPNDPTVASGTVGCITTKVGGPSFDRPNGSGNGRKAISDALTSTPWFQNGPPSGCSGGVGVGVSGQIDWSRSSSPPPTGSPITTQQQIETLCGPAAITPCLQFLPFARDAVSYAYWAGPNVQPGAVNQFSQAFLQTLYSSASGTNTTTQSRTVADGVTNGTTTVTSATANFGPGDVGAAISGSTIPGGDTIASVTNSTTAVLVTAAAAGNPVSLTITNTITARACMTQTGSGTSSFFVGAIGGSVTLTTADAAGAANSCNALEENGANSFVAKANGGVSPPAVNTVWLEPFSVGSWISQFNKAAQDRSATGRADGVTVGDAFGILLSCDPANGGPGCAAAGNANRVPWTITSTGAEKLDTFFAGDLHWGRNLFLIAPWFKLNGTGSTDNSPAEQNIFGSDFTLTNGALATAVPPTGPGALCFTGGTQNAQTEVDTFGFLQLTEVHAGAGVTIPACGQQSGFTIFATPGTG
jgi:hypothetical protein